MFFCNKKIICLFISIGLGLAVCFSNQNSFVFKTGDLNLDGKIDILDLNLLQQFLLQKNSLVSIGDQNGDNKIDVIDLQILYNHLEKKWQGKRTDTPVDFLQIHTQSLSHLLCRVSLINLRTSLFHGIEQKHPLLPRSPEDRTHKITKELHFLTGFLCHAPPVC